jgi:hypothetical protein
MTWLSILLFLIKWGPTIFSIIQSLPGVIALIRELFGMMRGLPRAQRVLQTKKLEVIFASAKARGKTVSTETLLEYIDPLLVEWKAEVAKLKTV